MSAVTVSVAKMDIRMDIIQKLVRKSMLKYE